MKLTHVSSSGDACMMDVSRKDIVRREVVAVGMIHLQPSTIELIKKNKLKKGDVLSVARVAAVQAAKKTPELIPFCHNLLLDHIDVKLPVKTDSVKIESRAICHGRTGVEMEALAAVAVAALAIYDMCKAVDKKMVIGDISLKEKIKHEVHR